MHIDTGLSRIGRSAGVVAPVPRRGISHRENTRRQLVRRHRDAVLLVVVDHSFLVIPVSRKTRRKAKIANRWSKIGTLSGSDKKEDPATATLTKRRTTGFRWHVLVCIPAAASIPRLYANQALPEFLLRPLASGEKMKSEEM